MYGIANKNNNFNWADGMERRLVMWNGPNYESFHLKKKKLKNYWVGTQHVFV